MRFRISFITCAKALKSMEPGYRPFDDPSVSSKSLLGFNAFAGYSRYYTERRDERTIFRRRVSFICVEIRRFPLRPPTFPSDMGEINEETWEREDVRHVGSRESNHERNPTGVNQKMVFAASFPTIRGVWSRESPPFSARTLVLSTIARYRFNFPDARNCFRMIRCMRDQTFAFCQVFMRRQQVVPLPHSNSIGRCFHAMPVRRT
jgi:hypothetical protein